MLRRIIQITILLGLWGGLTGPAEAARGGAVTIQYKDTAHLEYRGDWAEWHDSKYLSQYTGSRKRTGTVTCSPRLKPGVYEIRTKFKATANRGDRARYYVNKTLVKELDQHERIWKADYGEASLGVYELDADSTVMLEGRDGKSYSLVHFSFTPSDDTPGGRPGSGSGSGSGTDTPGPGANDPGSDGADGAGEFTVAQDGELVIRPYLTTYHPAAFHVEVDGKRILSWERSDDRSRELCVFDGVPDEASMREGNPGDFSAVEGLVYRYPVKAGQKVRGRKRGQYLPQSYLKIQAPTTGPASLQDVLGGGS